ncbi:unnamed protein product, partial [Rotaria sp. Silwood2]
MPSSDNILIELVAELYQRTKKSSTLSYEALLLLRPLSLLLVHIACLMLSACPSYTIVDA